jgi:ADP-dependent NAD(P)H-hydrate dehydratase / NAD(P)H-hydrate epimerase
MSSPSPAFPVLPSAAALRQAKLQQFVVTADQMRQIEARLFAAGMPVAALMEKVGGLLADWLRSHYPAARVGVLVGAGHNGADALVVARELHLNGYSVKRYQPLSGLKELTQAHARYADHLGILLCSQVNELQDCDLILDGLFGFGLNRPLAGELVDLVDWVNQAPQPVVSLDLPSGLHTDTGAPLGRAIRATHTLCLGLWKQGLLQDEALAAVGQAELIDFGLPLADVEAVLGSVPSVNRLTPELALSALPLPRPATTHKYQQGHLLLVCGSRQYVGAAILAGAAARASGVGMLSIAVPESMRLLLIGHLPDAVVIGCPETDGGAIAQLPDLDLTKYQAISCGPGLTKAAVAAVQAVLAWPGPLLLDADGLNILADLLTQHPQLWQTRPAATVLTPHWGEFKRLFPALIESSGSGDRLNLAQTAAQQSGAIVLLKGARTIIAAPNCEPDPDNGTTTPRVWLNPNSTPALARGGSGDVLTGLMGGLLAQAVLNGRSVAGTVSSAAWWHAQAGVMAAQQRSELGVDASTLIQFLIPALTAYQNHPVR